MSQCNPKSTPCDLNTVNADFGLPDQRVYRKLVGSLIFMMGGRANLGKLSVAELSAGELSVGE